MNDVIANRKETMPGSASWIRFAGLVGHYDVHETLHDLESGYVLRRSCSRIFFHKSDHTGASQM
jgi:hypothetical protein